MPPCRMADGCVCENPGPDAISKEEALKLPWLSFTICPEGRLVEVTVPGVWTDVPEAQRKWPNREPAPAQAVPWESPEYWRERDG